MNFARLMLITLLMIPLTSSLAAVEKKPTPSPEAVAAAAASKAELAELCRVDDVAEVKRVYLPKDITPNYFHRVLSKKDIVLFARGWLDAYGKEANQTYVLDLASGKIMRGPGNYDMVPLLDEELFTQPGSGNNSLNFYRAADVLKLGQNAQPLGADNRTGVYQSAGILEKKDAVTIHRVITDSTQNKNPGLAIRDYAIHSPVKAGGDIKFDSELQWVCENRILKLPMLSKDGLYLAALDESGRTSVFEIGRDNSRCKEILNLGVGTGKADFSFDGRYLAFHKSANAAVSNAYDRTPSKTWHENIFVYEMKTGEIKQITHNTSGNSTYPVFRQDGTIIFQESKVGDNGGTVFSYVVADPSKVKGMNLKEFSDSFMCTKKCKDGPSETKAVNLAVLGLLWNAVCTKNDSPNPYATVMWALSLDPDKCRQLVQTKWSETRAKALKTSLSGTADFAAQKKMNDVDEARLLAACPTMRLAPNQAQIVGKAAETTSTLGEIFAKKCSMCHSSGQFAIDFKDFEKLFTLKARVKTSASIGDEIIRRTNPMTEEQERMPLGSRLDDSEIKILLDTLGPLQAKHKGH